MFVSWRKKLGFLTTLTLLFSSVVLPAQAASAPNIITYQGRVLNANGVPVSDGSLSMIFELYTASTGGTCVWSNSSATCATATARSVTLTTGLFTENLGDTVASYAAIGDSIFGDNAALYLQVTIAGEALSPRRQITAAPYALNADTLDGIDSATLQLFETGSSRTFEDDAPVIIGSNAALTYASGGVGDLRVEDELEVMGDGYIDNDLVIGASTSSTETITNAGFSLSGNDLFVASDLGVEGTVYVDGGLDVVGTITSGDLSCTDCLDFTELSDTLALDASTSIAMDGTEIFTITNGSSGNTIVNLTSTGDLEVQDGGSTFVTFSDSGTLTVDGASTFNTDVDLTLATTENLTLTNSTATAEAIDLTVTAAGNDAVELNFTLGNDTDADTVNVIEILVTSASTGDADVLRGLTVGDLSSAQAGVTETGIVVGSGWDSNLTFADTTAIVGISDTGNFVINDGTNTLLTLTDNSNIGDLVVTGDFTAQGDNIDSAGAPLILNATAADEVRIGTGTPGIATGTGDFYVTDAIEVDGAIDARGSLSITDFNGVATNTSINVQPTFSGTLSAQRNDYGTYSLSSSAVDRSGNTYTVSGFTGVGQYTGTVGGPSEINGVYGAGVLSSSASTAPLVLGVKGEVTSTVAGGTITDARAVYGNVGLSNGSVTTAYGGYFEAPAAGSSSRYGIYGKATTDGGGNATTLYGVDAVAVDGASGNATTAYGIRATASGATTNNFAGYFYGAPVVIDDDTTFPSLDFANGTGDLFVRGTAEIGSGMDLTGTLENTIEGTAADIILQMTQININTGGALTANRNIYGSYTTMGTSQSLAGGNWTHNVYGDWVSAAWNTSSFQAADTTAIYGRVTDVSNAVASATAVDQITGEWISLGGLTSMTGTATNAYGLDIDFGSSSDFSVTNYRGVNVEFVDASPTVTYPDVRGVNSSVQMTAVGGGTMTSAYGVYSTVANSGSGTITTAYGVFAQTDEVGGGAVIGTGYGVYATATDATTNWSIYVPDGGADAAFNDDVFIGAEAETLSQGGFALDGNDLYVAGMVGIEGNIYTDGALDVVGASTLGTVTMDLATIAATQYAVCHTNSDTDDEPIGDCSGAPTADYAEQYPVATGITYGDIVVPGTQEILTTQGQTITKLIKSTRAYEGPIVGVVSDNYGDFTSAGYNINEADNPMPVALVGRVPVKVTSEGGSIFAGDYLTTSSTPGAAMKATKAGRVIGMALEDWDGVSATVMVQVNNSWSMGDVLGEDGTSTFVTNNVIVSSVDTANSQEPSFDSYGLALRGSAWNGSEAEAVEMMLKNVVDDQENYRLSIRNTSESEIAYITNEGTMKIAGDMVIGGHLYPSDRGTPQTEKYIYYDGSSGAGGDFMRTNAKGWSTGSYDFAEMFPSSTMLTSGDLVAFFGSGEFVQRATGADGEQLAGIVSTRPGFLAGENVQGAYPIALAGRVPTKVNLENGAIVVGDPLTVSSTSGEAMKATQAGQIVGYALEDYTGTQTDNLILTFVNVGYWSGGPQTITISENSASEISTSGTQNYTALNMSGNIYMATNQILSIGRLEGISALWSIESDGTIKTQGSIKTVTTSYQGTNVETIAVTSPESVIALSGTSVLVNGRAEVRFEDILPEFNDVVSAIAPIRVILTPSGPVSLYVSEKDQNHFIVDRFVGTADVEFDWMVTGYRKGFEPPEEQENELQEETVAPGFSMDEAQEEEAVEDIEVVEAEEAVETVEEEPAPPESPDEFLVDPTIEGEGLVAEADPLL